MANTPTATRTVDLWPADIGQAAPETGPAALLNEQAALLSQKTGGIVKAELRGEQDPQSGDLIDNFYLFAPKLKYRYLLFSIAHPLTSYPARLRFEPLFGRDQTTVNDSAELADVLGQIFAHEQTRQIIGAILARSQ